MGFDFGDLFDFLDQGAQSVGEAAAPAAESAGESVDPGSLSGLGFDVANLGGANPSTFNPADVGPPPAGGPSPEATIGSVQPGQGAAGPSSPIGGSDTDPEALARQGQLPGQSGGSEVGSMKLAPPPPTAWESIKDAPGKWWAGAQNEFNKNPIGTTAKVGALAAPFVGAGIAAMNQPKQPGKYTLNPPATPASAQAGSDTMPVASPMSTTLTGQGGFKVQPGQGFAEGGKVSDQDKADYDEAMRQFKGQSAPAQPAPKPKSAYDQQLEDADKGKQSKPSSYFKSPWSR